MFNHQAFTHQLLIHQMLIHQMLIHQMLVRQHAYSSDAQQIYSSDAYSVKRLLGRRLFIRCCLVGTKFPCPCSADPPISPYKIKLAGRPPHNFPSIQSQRLTKITKNENQVVKTSAAAKATALAAKAESVFI